MHTACDTAHLRSVPWLLLNMLQHILGNSLQCGGVSFLMQKINCRSSHFVDTKHQGFFQGKEAGAMFVDLIVAYDTV